MRDIINQSIFIYLLIAIACVVLIFGISWFLEKQQEDSKKVRWWLYYELDRMMYYVNSTINKLSATDTKFDDLIYVIYAKKRWFIENKKHDLNSWYEVWLATKDSLDYLELYTKNQDIYHPTDLEDSSSFFDFLYKLKTVSNVLKTTNIILFLIVIFCIYMIIRNW